MRSNASTCACATRDLHEQSREHPLPFSRNASHARLRGHAARARRQSAHRRRRLSAGSQRLVGSRLDEIPSRAACRRDSGFGPAARHRGVCGRSPCRHSSGDGLHRRRHERRRARPSRHRPAWFPAFLRHGLSVPCVYARRGCRVSRRNRRLAHRPRRSDCTATSMGIIRLPGANCRRSCRRPRPACAPRTREDWRIGRLLPLGDFFQGN